MHERLNVLLCDVVSGHGRKVGSGLLLNAQLPIVACYRHNNNTSDSASAPARLKQPWLSNLINAFYANVLIL